MRDFALLRDIASLLTEDPSFRFRVVAMPKHRAGFQFSPNVEFLWDLSDEEIAARFDGQHLAGFVAKPYRLKDLRDALRKVLDPPRPAGEGASPFH